MPLGVLHWSSPHGNLRKMICSSEALIACALEIRWKCHLQLWGLKPGLVVVPCAWPVWALARADPDSLSPPLHAPLLHLRAPSLPEPQQPRRGGQGDPRLGEEYSFLDQTSEGTGHRRAEGMACSSLLGPLQASFAEQQLLGGSQKAFPGGLVVGTPACTVWPLVQPWSGRSSQFLGAAGRMACSAWLPSSQWAACSQRPALT